MSNANQPATQLKYKMKYKIYSIQSDTTLLLCLTVLYIFYILIYILAYVQHNGNVSLKKKTVTQRYIREENARFFILNFQYSNKRSTFQL